ncbi:MAG: hypothetical protein C0518_08225 [Opitutus sp.]|nr:hypothetical protein [Opitutus sp.]
MRVLALFLALVVSASAADLKIVRVFTGWRDGASFKRISEYFTGRENTGGQVVIRTQPAERSGYYFLVRLENSGPAQPAKFVFHVVLPASPRPRTFKFPAQLPAGKTVFNFGLTGTDWPDPGTSAMAWKLDVLDDAGATLVTEQSYLWEKPGQ